MAAAAVAAEAGLNVCLIDDNRKAGGQIWRGFKLDTAARSSTSSESGKWSQRLERTRCVIRTESQVIDHPAPNTLRIEHNGEVNDLTYGKLILATGARERFLPFPGWTLPGVIGAGALQAFVKSGLDVHGKRVVVAGSGPLLLAIAAGLTDAGARIIAIYEQAPLSRLMSFAVTLTRHPRKITEGLRYARKLRAASYRTGCWVKFARGSAHLDSVTVTDGRREWTHDCDWLACGFHLVPNLELPLLVGCTVSNGYIVVDEVQQSSVRNVACVGELTGIGGLDKALLEGEIAGLSAAGREDQARAFSRRLNKLLSFVRRLDQAFALRNELRTLCDSQTVVCRCEDVAYSTVQPCASWREAKLHTRCGMGPCQGRICGPQTEFLCGWRYSGVRPPLLPAELSSMAAASQTAVSEARTIEEAQNS